MQIKDGEAVFHIEAVSDGNDYWIGIAKDGTQIGNPAVTANDVVELIRDLKYLLHQMTDSPGHHLG
jgi:hypothetical protein